MSSKRKRSRRVSTAISKAEEALLAAEQARLDCDASQIVHEALVARLAKGVASGRPDDLSSPANLRALALIIHGATDCLQSLEWNAVSLPSDAPLVRHVEALRRAESIDALLEQLRTLVIGVSQLHGELRARADSRDIRRVGKARKDKH